MCLTDKIFLQRHVTFCEYLVFHEFKRNLYIYKLRLNSWNIKYSFLNEHTLLSIPLSESNQRYMFSFANKLKQVRLQKYECIATVDISHRFAQKKFQYLQCKPTQKIGYVLLR